MIDWKQKLTSRITAIIIVGATAAAYIVGEGLVDSASAGAHTVVNGYEKAKGINIPASTQTTQPDSTCAANT